MERLFDGAYKGTTVFLTGHTGFKGSWLAYWLTKMGARVIGYSLPAPSTPSHWENLNLDMHSIEGDIRDGEMLTRMMQEAKPDIVFHLAAQPIVRDSYTDPVNTYSSNVMGTLHMCEACRKTPSVKSIVSITTDKVYHNNEWWWGYREPDALGGHDPYSSSKACAEILLASYRNSFFPLEKYGEDHNVLLATVRAGNVIGGGDWANARLIPDIMRATSKGEQVTIRSPYATRPWQHVLECLSGYLSVGEQLLKGNKRFAEAFNFGPPDEDALCVEEAVKRVVAHWPAASYEVVTSDTNPHEAGFLKLDCSKAYSMLKWHPVWAIDETFKHTVSWYRKFYDDDKLATEDDLAGYIADARKKELPWAL